MILVKLFFIQFSSPLFAPVASRLNIRRFRYIHQIFFYSLRKQYKIIISFYIYLIYLLWSRNSFNFNKTIYRKISDGVAPLGWTLHSVYGRPIIAWLPGSTSLDRTLYIDQHAHREIKYTKLVFEAFRK